MSLRWFVLCMAALLGSIAWAEDKAKPAKSGSLAEQIAAIKKEHQQRQKKFYDELHAAKDNKAILKANQDYNEFTGKQADKLKALIRANGKDPAAFEGILALLGQMRYYLEDDLVQLVLEHHLANPKMGQLCFDIRYYTTTTWVEKFIKEIAAKHPQHTVRGQAVYALGEYNRYRAQPWGKKLSEDEQAKHFAKAVQYYTKVTKEFAEAQTPDGKHKLGDKAEIELIRIKNIPNLIVGNSAPEIEGVDLHGEKMRLSDYRGKVVLLDFWGHW